MKVELGPWITKPVITMWVIVVLLAIFSWKNSVFSAMHLRLPGVRGGLITTATRPWFGLKGWAGSTLLMFSPVTMATD